jgi:S-methylmethionine-dependent homocysteine/selenocysteine methylase
LQTRGAELIALSGKLAQKVKGSTSQNIKVAAGIPPVFGSYSPDDFVTADAVTMLEVFKQHLLPFTDIVLAETQSSIDEVTTIQKVFADCGQPLWISMTLEDATESPDPRLRSGELLSDALSAINLDQVEAILFNCSQPEVMAAACNFVGKQLPSSKNSWSLCQRIQTYFKYHSSQ